MTPALRIVSLLPSATEIVAALGAFGSLVGVTHECDWPTGVEKLPRVTRSAVDSSRSAGEIDAQVRSLTQAGSPLYSLDEPLIRSLAPDIILTQALCEVCAVHESDVRAVATRLSPSPAVITLSAETLEGVFDDICRVGEALAMTDDAEELLDGLRARVRAVHDTLTVARAPRPRVVVVEWTDPIFTAGHWVPEMVRRAGGIEVIGVAGERSRAIELDALRAADPEVIVFAPCGYDLTRAANEARATRARDAWAWARGRRMWAINANALASRPGPRLVDGIDVLARIIAPALFTPLDAAQAVALS